MIPPIVIDLAQPDRPRASRKRIAQAAAAGMLLLASLLNGAAYLRAAHEADELRVRLSELERRHRKVETQRKAQPDSRKQPSQHKIQAQLLERLTREDSYPWSALLQELESLLPPGVHLQELHAASPGGPLVLKGEAGGVEEAAAWLQRLDGSTAFRNPVLSLLSLTGTIPEKRREGEPIRFEIRVAPAALK
jgi:Tfp pilus assembly protein PilN